VPAANAANASTPPDDTSILPEFTAEDIIELRLTNPKSIPGGTQVFFISPAHVLSPTPTYHCIAMFDLDLILSRLNQNQWGAIEVLKIRWATAWSLTSEMYNSDRAIKT
jgi:hypothetical protein